MSKQLISKSKFLSLVLRHKPEEIGLTLDPEGWADLDELIRLSETKGVSLTREMIYEIVATNDKKRFAIDASGNRIRANQGHSVAVDLKLAAIAPPDVLFHGTATRFLPSIRQGGLIPGSRQHVHLSSTAAIATNVGARHGKPVVLVVQSGEMHDDGYEFYCSENGVWLTNSVPLQYLEFPDED